MARRSVRLIFLLVPLLALAPACGNGDRVESFCRSQDDLQRLQPGTQELQETLRELLVDAPEEVAPDLRVFARVNEKLAEGGVELNEDDIGDLEDATAAIVAFGDENC